MVWTRSTLRTALAFRLGRFNLSADLTTQLNYVLDAGLFRVVTDPVHQVAITKRDMIGWTWGKLTPSASGVFTQGSAVVTFAAETFLSKNVFAGDILEAKFSAGAERYLIYAVADATLNIGAPSRQTETVTTANLTIFRRTVELPSTGLVVGCSLLSTTDSASAVRELKERRQAAIVAPLTVGGAVAYSGAYDPGNDAAYLGLYYAPENATPVAIGQVLVPAAFSADGTELDWPEPTVDFYLEVCREIALSWMATQNPAVLQQADRMRRHAADGLYNTATGPGVFSR